jgi:hypothetical protein
MSKSKPFFILAFVVILFVLNSCSPNPTPHVIAWQPGAIDQVSPTPLIELRFDQPMDADSIRSGFQITPSVPLSFTILFMQSAPAALTSPLVSPLKSKVEPAMIVRFTPQRPLDKVTRYQIALNASARSIGGSPLSQPFTAAFTTTGRLNVSFYPATGAEGITTDSSFNFTFSKPMDRSTVLSISFTPPISGSGHWLSNQMYYFDPIGFQPASRYTLRLAAGVRSLDGDKLIEDAVATFTTTRPGLNNYWPVGVDFSPWTVISMTFNAPVLTETVEPRFLVKAPDGRAVRGEIRWPSTTTLIFYPDKALIEGAAYSVILRRGVQSPLGDLPSDREFTYNFKIAAPPEMTGSTPRDGDLDASISDRVTLNFNVPMDIDAVERSIHITPQPESPRFEWSRGSETLDIVFNIDPAAQYTIALDDNARDGYARRLQGNRSLVFQAEPQEPIAWLVGPRNYWNSVYGTYNPQPVVKQYTQFRNIDQLNYQLFAISSTVFLNAFQSQWSEDPSEPSGRFVMSWTQVVSAPLNKLAYASTEVRLPGGDSLAPGAYKLRVSDRTDEVNDWRVLIVSPINLTLKRSAKQIVVWATDLRSGQMIPNLPLTVYDQDKNIVARGQTNEQGALIANQAQCLDEWECEYGWRALYVMTDDAPERWGFLSSTWDDGIRTRDFQMPYYYGASSHTVFLYSDRPIYRPDQTVYFKGVIRQDNDGLFTLPKFFSVPVTIQDAQGNEIYREDLPVTDMGTFYGEVKLAAEAALGSYTVMAAYTETEPSARGNFRVAEYRKPEFKVSVTPSITQPIDGDVLTVTVQADYYFGAPMPNARVQWRLSSTDYYFTLPNEWYGFGECDEAYWLWGQNNNRGENIYANGTGTTDANGSFTFNVPIDLSKAKRSQVLTFEADVIDQNNQVTSARGYAVAHQSDLYIGVKPRRYVSKPNNAMDIQVVAAGPDRQLLPNVPLTVELYDRAWNSVRVRDNYGAYHWQSTYRDTLISTQVVTTAIDGKALALVTPPRGGEYRVVVRGQLGQQLNCCPNAPSIATAYFWTYGGEYVNWGIQNDDRINVIADKRTYQAGETAHLLITAPFSDSTALISIERGGVLRYWTQAIHGTSALIDVPIRSDYAPNAYVSVILLKGQAPDYPAADFKIGYVALNVDLNQQQLKVELIPDRSQYAPRDSAIYKVRVTDYLSRPVQAEVSLSLIDAAVLALVGDQDRDILTAFYRQRGLGVHSSLSLVTSVDRMTAILDKKAKGGGGGGDVSPRDLFADTAFWKAAVRTNSAGEATIEVPLPDNLTTWRMRAKAVTVDTRLGQGEVDVITTKPFVLRPVLPRFFTIGDVTRIGAIVHNYTPLTETMKVSCILQNAGSKGQGACGEVKSIVVSPNNSAPVYWNVIAPRAISITFTLAAQTIDGRGDAVRLALPINSFYEDVPTINYESITGTQSITVRLPPKIDRSRDELIIETEPSLVAGIDSGLEYLVGFPYGCVEQTMSSFLPDVVVLRLIKTIGVDVRPGFNAQLNAMITEGLQRLYGYQHNDGGWGWWKDDETNPSITAYVLYGLHQMESAGRPIDHRVRENAIDYLTNWLKTTSIDAPIGSVHGAQFVSTGVNVRAFALYVLAELGEGDPGLAGRLYEERGKLDRYGSAFLALALHLTNGNQSDARVETLLENLRAAAKTDGRSVYWQDKMPDDYGMSTSTRTTAITLDALIRLSPDDPKIDQVVGWLMKQRTDGHWQTTQETSMSLVALTDYVAASFENQGNYTYTVSINGQALSMTLVTPQTVGKHGKWIIPLDSLGDGDPIVTITRGDGPGGPLRANVSLRQYRTDNITAIDDRGVHVSRAYSIGGGKTLKDLTVGDIVTVTLRVRYDKRTNYVIVEDSLPAGLEAIDNSLATTAQNLGDQANRWYWNHIELRDDRVALFSTWMYYDNTLTYTYQARATTAGTFNVLPLKSYAMYNPDVIGQTAGMVLTIKEK